ncbi:MAG: ABC transporter ATP-binding protein [Bdellovibrionales bacterium]|nr:ABC transporter ATP-binding protein [Bdellovibrionales bacterium]
MTFALSLDRVTKTFGAEAVFRDFSLQIERGEFVTLLGPSGCGKSTLLRILAGLDTQVKGSVLASLGLARRSFVFQEARLLPWRRVLDNVALPLELQGVAPAERAERARVALNQVGLGGALELYPRELSGGMQMRASLARALVTQPEVLFLDEPFAALDEPTRYALDAELRRLWVEARMTIVFVTHSLSEAVYLSERIVALEGRPARVASDQSVVAASVGQMRAPDWRLSAEFAGQLREFTDRIHSAGGSV